MSPTENKTGQAFRPGLFLVERPGIELAPESALNSINVEIIYAKVRQATRKHLGKRAVGSHCNPVPVRRGPDHKAVTSLVGPGLLQWWFVGKMLRGHGIWIVASRATTFVPTGRG
jgi:hypothetical protein